MFELRLLEDEINGLHQDLMQMIDEDLDDTLLYRQKDARYNNLIERESQLRKKLGLCLHHNFPKNQCPICLNALIVKSMIVQRYTWPYN